MNSERSSGFLIAMGQRIARWRKELRLTQETVAERMGVSLQTVSCFELGKKSDPPRKLGQPLPRAGRIAGLSAHRRGAAPNAQPHRRAALPPDGRGSRIGRAADLPPVARRIGRPGLTFSL